MKIGLWMLLFILSGCLRATSPREREMRRAEEMEKKGFDDTAYQLRDEARHESAERELELGVGVKLPKPKPGIVDGSFYGNERVGYRDFPKVPVSVELAVELAKPYLKVSMNRRSALTPKRAPGDDEIIQVTLRGSSYYIVKDVYPPFFSPVVMAVRVDAATGTVSTPD